MSQPLGPRASRSATASMAVSLALLPMGCGVQLDRSPASAAVVRAQDLGDLPYHPVVFHLDLSILAYQLYGQTLLWPFDPYYEELAGRKDERDAFMDLVRGWAAATGDAQGGEDPGLDAIRGPGVLAGFGDNASLDPVLYRYSGLHPWSPSITNADGTWTEYRTPSEVTDPIGEVWACTRTLGAPEGVVSVEQLAPPADLAAGARDVLLVFEGGTGDKGEADQPASQSMMGFALLRHGDDDAVDLHIAFRGSRSGSATRALIEALSTGDARGNADWVTDLGYRNVDAPWVSTTGKVARGMSRAVQLAAPQLFACLDQVAGDGPAPRNVYVTGHSLGGGLAQLFVSALLLGDAGAPGGLDVPASIASWPWGRAKLVTFGAPRVGDEAWARALTEDQLDMPFFDERWAYDRDALSITAPTIVPRLVDPDQSAAYRVLIPTDPITSSLTPGTFHVGQSVYLQLPRESFPADGDDHEPVELRADMVDTLDDPERIPAEAWRYVPLADWVPTRDPKQAGTEAEYEKLVDAVREYQLDHAPDFDHDAYEAGVDDFMRLLRAL